MAQCEAGETRHTPIKRDAMFNLFASFIICGGQYFLALTNPVINPGKCLSVTK